MTTTRRVRQLSSEQSLERLETVPIGRVVFTDAGRSAVLPVAFVVDGGTVVLRTAAGSRLARAGERGALTFEADSINSTARTGWSVVVTGRAELETDPDTQRRLATRLVPWVPGLKEAFVRIRTASVTGREIDVH